MADAVEPPGATAAEDDFSSFVTRSWPKLVRIAFLLTGDHAGAEDLAQATLVRTHRRWRSITHRDRPEVYVHRVMVNLHRSWWRRHRGREYLMEEVPDRPAAAATDPAAGFEGDLALERALAALPPRMRATLVLRFHEDLSEQQTAEILGCSVGTVKAQTSRGLTRLREALGAVSPRAAGTHEAVRDGARRGAQPIPPRGRQAAPTLRRPR